MSRDINPFGLRMPVELREQLEQAAQEASRSMNAEIVERLKFSFRPLDEMEEMHAYAMGVAMGLIRAWTETAPKDVADYLESATHKHMTRIRARYDSPQPKRKRIK